MKTDFIPRTYGDLDTWEDQFTTKIAIHGPTVGLKPAEVTAIVAAIATHRASYTAAVAAKAAAEAAVSTMNTARAATVKEIRAVAKQVKASRDYTTAIGDELGIIGPESIVDLSSAMPTLKVSLAGGVPVIKFNKGKSQGVRISCKVTGEADFSFLAVDTKSPYTDSRPNVNPGRPETREYYAYYILNDAQVGLKSAVVSITV